ncbi:hypothetical protein DL96DRAFT_1805521 [Flagelloscypha sp. PMI_526]|nr:hypothetical protein DL96DRAFT_1805521 [Flagelloscypha sp. PMI_526]
MRNAAPTGQTSSASHRLVQPPTFPATVSMHCVYEFSTYPCLNNFFRVSMNLQFLAVNVYRLATATVFPEFMAHSTPRRIQVARVLEPHRAIFPASDNMFSALVKVSVYYLLLDHCRRKTILFSEEYEREEETKPIPASSRTCISKQDIKGGEINDDMPLEPTPTHPATVLLRPYPRSPHEIKMLNSNLLWNLLAISKLNLWNARTRLNKSERWLTMKMLMTRLPLMKRRNLRRRLWGNIDKTKPICVQTLGGKYHVFSAIGRGVFAVVVKAGVIAADASIHLPDNALKREVAGYF